MTSDRVPDGNAVSSAQDVAHNATFDYEAGSPHLRHEPLRAMVHDRLTRLVEAQFEATGRCRALEIGAGHGTFTQSLLAAGASVTVTETSSASADRLTETFGDRIEVRFDQTGEQILDEPAGSWDLAVMTSVIHHIPDYLTFLARLTELIGEGGSLFTVQDPLFYPRMSRTAHTADRVGYLLWRTFQGNYGRGIATRLRRLRGVYDESEPSDLVEYHVIRDGVDEVAIEQQLAQSFYDVEIFTYWSNQAPLLQRLGDRTRLKTTFGVSATGRHA